MTWCNIRFCICHCVDSVQTSMEVKTVSAQFYRRAQHQVWSTWSSNGHLIRAAISVLSPLSPSPLSTTLQTIHRGHTHATSTPLPLHTLSFALGTSQWHYASIKMSLKVLKCLCLKISVGYRNRFYWNMNTDLINVWSNVTREFSFETTLQLFIYNFSWKIVDLILNEINSWSHLHFYILLGWRNCYKSSWS